MKLLTNKTRCDKIGYKKGKWWIEMRKWRCIKSNLSSKETAMVGDIFETDDKGMFKWRNGERASYPIYEYTKYKFEEIKEEKKLTRDEMIYKIDHEYCDGRLCRDCVFDANCRDYDEVSDEELIKDYNLAFNIKEEKEEVEMNKFKVGDVVEIIGNEESGHGFNIGEIVTIDMICCKGEKGEHCRVTNNKGKSWYVCYIDIKLYNPPSTQSFTITVSDTITTLKSADKTVEVKRYYTDKHDVKVAIDNVVKKYFDEIEREERVKNRQIKGKGLLGVKVPKGTKFKVVNIEPHDDKGRVCMSEYIGKIGTFNRDFTFDKGRFHSSGTFDEEYMDAIDKRNGKLCWRYDEVEILWED